MAGVMKLHRGLVHTDLKCGVVERAATRSLARSLLKHPVANRVDQPARLCHRNELSRTDQAALGVTPANQCLSLVHRTGGQSHDGLERDPELTAIERQMHLVGQPHPVLGGLLQVGREEAEAVAPGRLGGVHGLVHRLKQAFLAMRVVGEKRNADAGRHMAAAGLQLKRLGQMGDDVLGNVFYGGAVTQITQNHHKLVASQPRNGVALSHAAAHPFAGLH